jgi:hypothetical protein
LPARRALAWCARLAVDLDSTEAKILMAASAVFFVSRRAAHVHLDEDADAASLKPRRKRHVERRVTGLDRSKDPTRV